MQEDSYFSFKSITTAIGKGVIQFHYELHKMGEIHQFTETLAFAPPKKHAETPKRSKALRNILNALHLILGISYWKTYCPKIIKLPNIDLTSRQADFWNTVYTKGLGELFYKNSIDFRGLIKFPFKNANLTVPTMTQSHRSLVLLGAGKDSIVTGELLRKHRKEFTFFVVNPTAIHKEIARRFDIPLICLKRTIDPKLIPLNAKPGVYNGHVPISSVWAFLGVFAALLYDFDYVIASNEESANYGNVSYLGSDINHQWSKSYEFEQLFEDYLDTFIVKGISYFSLLRPISEIRIARAFATLPKYFDTFTSCNTNFKIRSNPKRGQWCGKCPKCAFVFLLLAAFLPKDTVVSIFQKNLFSDDKLISTYRELLGLVGFKPFACVGTVEESLAAFIAVFKNAEYSKDPVITTLIGPVDRLVRAKGDPTKSVLSVSNVHNIPIPFQDIVASL